MDFLTRRFVLAFVSCLLFVLTGCPADVVKRQEEEITFPAENGEKQDTPVPTGDAESPSLPQISLLTAPSKVRPGQVVTVRIATNYTQPGFIEGAAIVIDGISGWFKADVQIKPGGETDGGLWISDLQVVVAESAQAGEVKSIQFALLGPGDEAGGFISWLPTVEEGGVVDCEGGADVDCTDRMCGPDPLCGQSCGECPGGNSCTVDGQCEGLGDACPDGADCTNRECGADPFCGVSCGECGEGIECVQVDEDAEAGTPASAACDSGSTSCGNGTVDAGEACDEGFKNGDGTQSDCRSNCTLTTCGDGFDGVSEGCDDGNNTDFDGCSATCEEELCGNGMVDEGEACDDGNNAAGDGCNPACQLEACGNGVVDPNEDCDDSGESATCDADCTEAACGDGTVNMTAEEACDDGAMGSMMCDVDCTAVECGDGTVNPLAGEACDDGGESAACDSDCSPAQCGDGVPNPTAGEACDDGGASAACTALCTDSSCGDGVVNSAAGEQCDDGNTVGGDGCTENCTLAACGNGVVDVGEDCDDAGESATCDGDCSVVQCGDGVPNTTAGEACDDGPFGSATCDADCTDVECGDGLTNSAANEICDDGGASPTCDADCTQAACGDGVTNNVAGETCDDGTETAACNSDCTAAECGDGTVNGTAGEQCDTGGQTVTCTSACSFSSCGDNIINSAAGETCDDGNAVGGDGCDVNCQLESCGNGLVDAGEDCDDGGESASCDADCTFVVCGDFVANTTAGEFCDQGAGGSATCDADCTAPSCGDGVLNTDAQEICDDGGESAVCNVDCSASACGDFIVNLTAGETCDKGAQGDSTCTSACQVPSCGDGVVTAGTGEVCDDTGESATCDADCTTALCGDGVTNTTAGETCDGGGQSVDCDADCTASLCGDGVLNTVAGEQCDDGNTTAGDGCDGTCQLESCGDGNVDAGEQCDDAGESTTCNANCSTASCGDLVTNATAGEACDDGVSGSANCRADCQAVVCGDGVTSDLSGEQCDDGGTATGDGCGATCQFEQCGNDIVDPGEDCDEGGAASATCDADCTTPVCGDFVVNAFAGEACDTGPGESFDCDADCTLASCGDGTLNGAAGEACDDAGESANCDVDCSDVLCGDGTVNATAGETCDAVGASPTCTDQCTASACGDSILNQAAGEQCDDGANNGLSPSNCDSNCLNDVCGNGYQGPSEQCDDGNADETDGCTSNCVLSTCGDGNLNAGEDCDEGSQTATCDGDCSAVSCGDGYTNTQAGEECDDGSNVSGDGCDAGCKLENCGNGITDNGEECDDGNGVDGDDCTDSCKLAVCGDFIQQTSGATIEDCDGGPSGSATCNANCTVSACGDGVLNTLGGENCDDAGESAACNVDCTPAACGDTKVNAAAGEQCDEGAETANCNANCTTASCGDGVLNTTRGESCDLGAGVNGTPGVDCTSTCEADVCGDGHVGSDEACDLAANNGQDGFDCTLTCDTDVCGNGQRGSGEACDEVGQTATCDADCTAVQCGDNVVNADALEECDDGGIAAGDGCDASCKLEECGNGVIDSGETCDDGTSNGVTDASDCLTNCQATTCGDNFNGLTEECDAGALNGDDEACTSVCTINVCGDGFQKATEQCDDNNVASDDGCSAMCQDEFCGDGVDNNVLEACDDGGDSQNCNGSSSGDPTLDCQTPSCGDGYSNGNYDPGFGQGAEQCDEGTANADTCPYGQMSCSVCTTQCVQAEVSGPVCGDGTIDGADGEVCDPPNLGGEDCNTQTAGASPFGTLACAGDCLSFDTTGCSATSNVTPVWPLNAGQWNSRLKVDANDYISSGGDFDLVPDTACVLDGGAYYHSAELELLAPGSYTCVEGWRNLEWFTDAFGQDCIGLLNLQTTHGSPEFSNCYEENGGVRVQFRVDGPLSTFIDAVADPETPVWLPNSVTVTHSLGTASSPATAWWSNPVEKYEGSPNGSNLGQTNPVVVVTDTSPTMFETFFSLESMSVLNALEGGAAVDVSETIALGTKVYLEGAYQSDSGTASPVVEIIGPFTTVENVALTELMGGGPEKNLVSIEGEATGTFINGLSGNGGDYNGDVRLLAVSNLFPGTSGIDIKNVSTNSPYPGPTVGNNQDVAVYIDNQGAFTAGAGLPAVYLTGLQLQGGLYVSGQDVHVRSSTVEGDLVFGPLGGTSEAMPGGNIFRGTTFGGTRLDGGAPYAQTVLSNVHLKIDDESDGVSLPPNAIVSEVYVEEADFDANALSPQLQMVLPGGSVAQGMSVNLSSHDGVSTVVLTQNNNAYGPKVFGLWVHNTEGIGSPGKKFTVAPQGGVVDPAQEPHLWYSAFVEKDTNMMAATAQSFRWDASGGFVGGKLFVDSATSGNSCDNQFASGPNFTMFQDTTCTSKNLAQLEMFDFVSATSQLMELAEWPAMRAYLDPLDASDPYVYQAAPPPGTVCGDGHLWGGEACDEGGRNTALCNSNCTMPACGDGLVNPASAEDCDPGSASPLCSACSFTAAFFTGCGDGSLDSDSVEACDDNNTISGDGCSATCQTEFCGNYRVDSGNTPCTTDAECAGIGPEKCDLGPSVCIVEECDDGPDGSLFCTPTCTPAPRPGQTREVEHVFHDSITLANQADCVRYFPGSTYDAGLNGCRTYVLIGASETIGDKDANLQPVGNENGLCESGETCTVLEHVGASQPSMSTGSYIFNGDFITGVTLE